MAQLLTKQLKARFKKVGEQETPDPIIIAKFFNPCGAETWYVCEYNDETKICYAYVTGIWEDEWGYFSLAELESLRCPPLGLPIERDLYFDEVPFSKLSL
jgi:hypothetical protein